MGANVSVRSNPDFVIGALKEKVKVGLVAKRKLSLIHIARAFAPFLVLVFHASLYSKTYLGYNFLGLSNVTYTGGVDFFFMLSGFLTFHVFSKDFGKIDKVKSFLIGRAMRIYPVYWIITIILTPMFFIIPTLGHGYERDPLFIFKSFFLIPQVNLPVVNVAWSLTETVFCYIIFAIIMAIGKKWVIIPILIWLSICIVFSIFNIHTIFIIKFLFSGDILKFAIGCGIAYIMKKRKIRYALPMILVGLSLFPLSWINFTYHIVHVPISTGYVIGSSFLITGCAAIDMLKEIKIPPILNYLGDASYSLYLSHTATISLCIKVFSILKIHNKIGIIFIIIICILIAILVGCAIYNFIEKPIANKLRSMRERF